MKSAEDKAAGIELKLKDFIPIAGLFSYNRRKIRYVMDNCNTPKDYMMTTLSALPRYGIIVAYNVCLLQGIEYLTGYLGK